MNAPAKNQLQEYEVFQPEGHPHTVIIRFVETSDLFSKRASNLGETIRYLATNRMETFIIDMTQLERVTHLVLGMISNLIRLGKGVKIICQREGVVFETFRQLSLLSVLPHYNHWYEAI